ncbi:MAG: hypothetical protein KAR35_03485 [Candidatus Heimdallarchaeota archaeon]|nr:hypothetical protein [Candidatus Heimdallarchaeota archaeon]MCK5048418.1 hypothetical protein [Candidatus Heimdallarchaeota archaeon]
MKRQTKLSIFILFLSLLLMTSTIATMGESHSIIDMKTQSDDFYPTFIDNYSYYIADPGVSLNGLSYLGETTDFEFTDATTSDMGISSDTYNDGDDLDPFCTSADSINIGNPFFDDYELARVMRYENFEANENYIQGTTTYPISLHNDYSYSFYGEAGKTYTGFSTYEDPFLLDITYSNPSSFYVINFINATSPFSGVIDCWEKTLPVIPSYETQMFQLTVYNADTILTLTPHKMPSKSPIKIKANSTYEGIIEQGVPSDPNAQEFDYESYVEDNEIFSLRYFSFEMKEGKDYLIDLNIYPMLDCDADCEYCCSLISCVESDITSFYLRDEILNDELVFDEGTGTAHAFTDTSLTVVLYSTGFLYHKYHFLFKEIETETNYEVVPLILNEPIEPVDGYYNLTLSADTMMAINCSTLSAVNGYDLLFYSVDEHGDYVYITDSDYNSVGFVQEENNLIGDSANDIGTNWVYIPEGNYVVKVNKKGEAEIQFNTVSIRSVSTSVAITSDQDEIFAFEFSPLLARFQDIYLINSDINQSVRYEYSLISKYQMISSTVNDVFLGDPDLGENENATIQSNLFLTSGYNNRILLVHPYSASNSTGDPQETFETDYTVLIDLIEEYQYINFLGEDGDFIYSNTMTNSLTLPVNDEKTTSEDQVFGIPISQEANNLYNVTIKLIGNYSASDYNITLDNAPVVSGGPIYVTNVFGDLVNGYSLDGYLSYSFVYLQVSSISYLFLDILRDTSADTLNGSIEITVSRIAVAKLELDIPDIVDLRWEKDRVDGEYKHSEKLLNEVSAPEHKSDAPLDFLSVGIGLGIVAVAVSIRRRKGR